MSPDRHSRSYNNPLPKKVSGSPRLRSQSLRYYSSQLSSWQLLYPNSPRGSAYNYDAPGISVLHNLRAFRISSRAQPRQCMLISYQLPLQGPRVTKRYHEYETMLYFGKAPVLDVDICPASRATDLVTCSTVHFTAPLCPTIASSSPQLLRPLLYACSTAFVRLE
jgi:hypothetical protein